MTDDVIRKSVGGRKPAEYYLQKAVEYEDAGLFMNAIGALEKAARASSDKAPIYKDLGELYRSQRMIDEAISTTRKAIQLKPDDIPTREFLIEILIELAMFDDAIHESQELLRYSPRSLSARDVLSIAYLQKGMLEKALQVTNELINLDPTSPANHFKKAILFQQKGDIGNAINEFGRVLNMHPDDDMAEDAQEAIETLDSHQLRHIVMLAVEDYIFRTKLIRDPETAATERGYIMSESGMATLKQIQFEELPEIFTEWKQRYYH